MNSSQVYEMNDSPGIKSHFKLADYIILVMLLLTSLVVGVVTRWRNKATTTLDFLTGGRNMNPFAVCLSLLGGTISAISVQGNSTEVYLYGTQLWMNVLGCLWGTIIVMFLILPVVYPLNLVSLCQYLEMRYHSSFLKKLGSSVQIVNQIMFLGICLYAPSLTLSSGIGVSTSLALTILGITCGIYVTLGGVRALVYTDVLQTSVMFLGVLIVVILVIVEIGGINRIWNIAAEGGRLQFFNFDPSPLVRHSFWSVQVLGTYFVVSGLGLSQPQFQRLLSVRNLRISRGLCVAFFTGLAMLWSLFYFSGLVAYAAYVDCDPVTSGKVEKPDQIVAFMVGDKLSHLTGMMGIFVAAVAAALLSSLSSYIHATVVMLWQDFLNGWWVFGKVTDETATIINKILCSLMVAVALSVAMLVSHLGTLFQAVYSISGSLVGPFDGLFLTSITAPWVNTKGAISGFVAALSLNMWLVIGKFWYEAGRSERLPLSTEGCSSVEEDLAFQIISNSTSATTTHGFTATSAPMYSFYNATIDSERDSYPWIYDISYCYLGSLGIITVFIVSTIVSFLTGVVKPAEVDRRLVSSTCYKVYCWLYSYGQEDTMVVSSLPEGNSNSPKDLNNVDKSTSDQSGGPV